MDNTNNLTQEGSGQQSLKDSLTDIKDLASQSGITIPVIEEELHVGKRVIETGKVRLSKTVHQSEESYNIPLTHEEIHVERVPVNQYLDAPPEGIRYEGDVTIIPVIKEVLVVEKRLMLVEEIRVTKHKVQTTESSSVSLRKEEVQVERITTGNTGDVV